MPVFGEWDPVQNGLLEVDELPGFLHVVDLNRASFSVAVTLPSFDFITQPNVFVSHHYAGNCGVQDLLGAVRVLNESVGYQAAADNVFVLN